MRFMMMVKADADYEAAKPPKPELMAAIGTLSAEMQRAGVLLENGGLAPSAQGAKVRVARGRVSVKDGPFTEAKEVVGGYAILRAGSRQEAIELGKRFMQIHADTMGSSWEGELEIRQLLDFGPEKGSQ